MSGDDARALRALLPLGVVSAVVVLVTLGLSRGLWPSNLHNGLLALAFTGVGAYVLHQRPGHLAGNLFLATGTVESVMFLGRQQAHHDGGVWWAWIGVWPIAIALGLVTWCVVFFPDGRLPSRHWRLVVAAVGLVTVACSAVSALWPVEYAAAGVSARHPWEAAAPLLVDRAWSAVAHPAYAVLQVLWVVAVVARWRRADGHERSQLLWLLGAAAVSAATLVVGLVGWGSATPGRLAAALVPLAAGWAIVHGQHLATYSALSWLPRTDAAPHNLPHDLARATAQALGAPRATIWMGDAARLHAVGVWPETHEPIEPTALATLEMVDAVHVRRVAQAGELLGALVVEPGARGISRAEERLLDDLAAQAALVLDRPGLSRLVGTDPAVARLDGLTPRERVVLELMARGLSNAAICDELHLSIKTIEPVVSAIFGKLRLHPDAESNRRVLAVLAYLGT